MNNILTKITVVGGLYLAILCLIPDIMIPASSCSTCRWSATGSTDYFRGFLLDGLNVQFYFGGTSLLIVVGVAMDTSTRSKRSSSCGITKASRREPAEFGVGGRRSDVGPKSTSNNQGSPVRAWFCSARRDRAKARRPSC
jgi:hypothetical protein